MDVISTSAGHSTNFVAETREVGGQDGRGYADRLLHIGIPNSLRPVRQAAEFADGEEEPGGTSGRQNGLIQVEFFFVVLGLILTLIFLEKVAIADDQDLDSGPP